jgi:hypothetical protein
MGQYVVLQVKHTIWWLHHIFATSQESEPYCEWVCLSSAPKQFSFHYNVCIIMIFS